MTPADLDEPTAWEPPFCANEIWGIECPECGEEAVCAREKESYRDGDSCEAYCGECHAALEVQVSVEVTFSDPETTGC